MRFRRHPHRRPVAEAGGERRPAGRVPPEDSTAALGIRRRSRRRLARRRRLEQHRGDATSDAVRHRRDTGSERAGTYGQTLRPTSPGLSSAQSEAHRPRHEDLALFEEGLVRVFRRRELGKPTALEITSFSISHPSYGRQRQRLEERSERGIVDVVGQVAAVQACSTPRAWPWAAGPVYWTWGFGLSSLQYMVLPNTSVSFFSSTAFNAVAASANSGARPCP